MKRFAICAAVLAALAIIVASCSDRPAVVTQAAQQAPAPVVVQQNDGSFWQMLFLHHMLFGGNQSMVVHHYDSRPAYVPPRAVVRNTTIVNKTVVQSAPQSVSPAVRPSAPAARFVVPSVSTPRPTTYSGSYSSRSSYSSYSARSSFSSGRR
ncbi:hypothetical protein [Burkholderia orbicola]|uniref:hypothetical protein n=1 Tax=Burkholderia orbicola TaxID=2978683 RepID=UPI00264B9B87|nr:hypothetical protein [Burkholderia orbicola]MDN7558200.1 hypothetical protein [Burkholderia orbicola]